MYNYIIKWQYGSKPFVSFTEMPFCRGLIGCPPYFPKNRILFRQHPWEKLSIRFAEYRVPFGPVTVQQ